MHVDPTTALQTPPFELITNILFLAFAILVAYSGIYWGALLAYLTPQEHKSGKVFFQKASETLILFLLLSLALYSYKLLPIEVVLSLDFLLGLPAGTLLYINAPKKEKGSITKTVHYLYSQTKYTLFILLFALVGLETFLF